MRIRPRGFTLIELLVVIAMLAILAAIIVPSLQRAEEGASSREVERENAPGPTGVEGDEPPPGTGAAIKGFLLGVAVTFVVMRFTARASEKKTKRVSRRRRKKRSEPSPETTSDSAEE